jgi:endonuclease/exonuclease/phosphatase family metal-dependent hydrolase
MPGINEHPPQAILQELAEFDHFLNQELPAKELDKNVMIATWNIRAFGDLTEKWEASEADTPKRDLHSCLVIARILQRFDIVAIQELKGNIKAFRHILKVLGPQWSFILTDVCGGDEGNGERLAFLFDTRKVKLSGLACELVVPNELIENSGEDIFRRQFARTPYAVGFQVDGKTFILVTLHIIYGRKIDERTKELKAIANWLHDWASYIHAFDQSLIVLGDFNIDRKGDERYEAFVSTGLKVPEKMQELRRTVYDHSAKYYDQIAWFVEPDGTSRLCLDFVQAGAIDFGPRVLLNRQLTASQLSWRISDHLPLWGEFYTR